VRVYSIFDPDDGGTTYYTTWAEAYTANKHYFRGRGEIERLTLVKLPPQKLAVLLLNGEHFVEKRERLS
jgi:hypothetical protein